ncbi:MAG: hypothetical protein H0X16_02165 [Chloroflexi bacterium]|nr:hypothetical protein [Chloroflexota bacterium]
MPFDPVAALTAGAVAGLLMTLMRASLGLAGLRLRLHVLRLWGHLLGLRGIPARIAGLVIHVVGSAAIGLAYAAAFAALGIADNVPVWGLIGGAAHWAIAGVFMAVVPAFDPDLPLGERPGAFVVNHGARDVVVFTIGHLMYGLAFTFLYLLLASS